MKRITEKQMTVGDLIALLAKYPQEAPVLISVDDEWTAYFEVKEWAQGEVAIEV